MFKPASISRSSNQMQQIGQGQKNTAFKSRWENPVDKKVWCDTTVFGFLSICIVSIV